MSSGQRVRLQQAKDIADDLLASLANVCEDLYVCGSVRRNKPSVGDIEIVARPDKPHELLNRLDQMLAVGTIKKAEYGNGHRWGDKYRGMIYQRVKVEIFIADRDNLGYIQWLRTGPGDANQYLMDMLKRHQSSIRLSDGYAWHVTYYGDTFEKINKLRIPTEWDFFRLFGMPLIPPAVRNVINYRSYLERGVKAPAADAIRALYAGGQMRLF